jgi:hypothetical protein
MRFLKAVGQAVIAFFIGGITSCAVFTFMVRNSPDGQAGMGAAFGGFYVACIAAIVTFIISVVRSSPSRKKSIED